MREIPICFRYFLPAAGYHEDTSLSGVGSTGDYWSSMLTVGYSFTARYLDFDSGNYSMDFGGRRSCGFSVRPVLR